MPRPLFTPGKDPVGAENLTPPPGFDSRTVQPIGMSSVVYDYYCGLSTLRYVYLLQTHPLCVVR